MATAGIFQAQLQAGDALSVPIKLKKEKALGCVTSEGPSQKGVTLTRLYLYTMPGLLKESVPISQQSHTQDYTERGGTHTIGVECASSAKSWSLVASPREKQAWS